MLRTGDKVQCRLYNEPEHKFYADIWEGEIKLFSPNHWFSNTMNEKAYYVTRPNCHSVWLRRKEILRKVK